MSTHNVERNEWFFPRGSLESGPWETVVDSNLEGWNYTGVRVAELSDGEELHLDAQEIERVFVPLSGGFTIDYQNREGKEVTQKLVGRPSVFAGTTDVLYLGANTPSHVSGPGRILIAESTTDEELDAFYLAKKGVPVELRGRGINSRQVHNFGTPQVLPASKMMVVEVITPSGNWSSFPPHKHDTHVPGHELPLEEIYYFESQVSQGFSPDGVSDAHGIMRTYSSEAGDIEVLTEVRNGDVVLVPFGYHGPTIATPGYDLYMLNVMAGPVGTREWLLTEDPHHTWTKSGLESSPIDPRLPLTSA
jgi:5-deoxy-glucuronate isomerase